MTDTRLKEPRQAVVLIHGIGEQRPTETLRSFVAAFLKPGTYYSKPDTLSESFELRRFKLRKVVANGTNPDWPETDFYEYYWAHHMYGTTFAHISSWLWILMRRGLAAVASDDDAYHPRLKWLVPLVWLVVLATIAGAIYLAIHPQFDAKQKLGVTALVLLALWRLGRGAFLRVLTDSAGDAARYFDVNPRNVPRRYDILRGGVAMLRKLHEDHDEAGSEVMYRYSRIVLVGHSLGSVIAYDILRHYWHEVNGSLPVDREDMFEVESFEGGNGKASFDGAKPHTDPERYRAEQRRAWFMLNKRCPPGQVLPSKATRWLVTDLVTVGSPLTYAPVLMANLVADLNEKKALRELPTCPPDRSRNLEPGHFSVKLSAEADRFDDYYILPQGAYFAVTRWTNLFFDKDPIGGPLANVFGQGVEDVALDSQGLGSVQAHVSYWNAGMTAADPAIARIQQIIKERS